MDKKERAIIAVARWINRNDRKIQPTEAIRKAEIFISYIRAGVSAYELVPMYNNLRGVRNERATM